MYHVHRFEVVVCNSAVQLLHQALQLLLAHLPLLHLAGEVGTNPLDASLPTRRSCSERYRSDMKEAGEKEGNEACYTAEDSKVVWPAGKQNEK